MSGVHTAREERRGPWRALPGDADGTHGEELAEGLLAGAARHSQRDLPGWPGAPPAEPAAQGAARAPSTRPKRQQAVPRPRGGGSTARLGQQRHPQSPGTESKAAAATAERSAQGTERVQAGGGTDFLAQLAPSRWVTLCSLSHGGHEDLDEHSLLLARQRCGRRCAGQRPPTLTGRHALGPTRCSEGPRGARHAGSMAWLPGAAAPRHGSRARGHADQSKPFAQNAQKLNRRLPFTSTWDSEHSPALGRTRVSSGQHLTAPQTADRGSPACLQRARTRV